MQNCENCGDLLGTLSGEPYCGESCRVEAEIVNVIGGLAGQVGKRGDGSARGSRWVDPPPAPDDSEPSSVPPAPSAPVEAQKPTNPKDVIGTNKLPLGLWPVTATALGSLAMLEGLLKYGLANYRAIGVRNSIYVDACLRHLFAYQQGEDLDPDSGLPHLGKALACLAIIIDAKAAGKLNDDRPISGGYVQMAEDMSAHVKRLREQHKDKNPRHYTVADNTEFGVPSGVRK